MPFHDLTVDRLSLPPWRNAANGMERGVPAESTIIYYYAREEGSMGDMKDDGLYAILVDMMLELWCRCIILLNMVGAFRWRDAVSSYAPFMKCYHYRARYGDKPPFYLRNMAAGHLNIDGHTAPGRATKWPKMPASTCASKRQRAV